MTTSTKRCLALLSLLGLTASLFAQRYNNGFGGFGGGQIYVSPTTQTAREVGTRSVGTPEWKNPVGFEGDVFTFARLRYDTVPAPYYNAETRGGWTTDFPDADLNLSYRLQQMTALKVDPNARIVRATDPDLFRYPFLFAAAPQNIALSEAEVTGLRNYLLNGGFMLLTDFWGNNEMQYLTALFKRILPDYHFEDLPITHPLYQAVFKITEKQAVPNIRVGMKVQGQTVHHWVIFDSKGRIMVMGLHNSDDSDGWEREGEDVDYFQNYSEKIAYPLAINIIFYIMTH